MKTLAVLALLALSTVLAKGATFTMGPHGTLTAKVPENWTAQGRQLGEKGFDLTITPKGDINAQSKVTFLFADKKPATDQETLRKLVLAAGQRFASGSVEKKVIVKDFSMKHGRGAYCQFTDASLVGKPPIKRNYKTTSSGVICLADQVMASVTILCDDFASDEFKVMKEIVESLEIKTTVNKPIR